MDATAKNKVDKPRKHGRSTYLKYKCRCDICVTDAREYRRRFRVENIHAGLRVDAEPLLYRLERDGREAAIESKTRSRWRAEGIELYNADKWAIRLGYHPIEIWGQDFYRNCFDRETVA